MIIDDKETRDQIAAIMLRFGTPQQQEDAFKYCLTTPCPNQITKEEQC